MLKQGREALNKIEEMKEQNILRFKPDLSMRRVPKEWVDKFKEEAKHYCDDYGMTLVMIMKERDNLKEKVNVIDNIGAILQDHEMRISGLEGSPKQVVVKEENQGKEIKLMSGRVIKVKK